MHIMIPSCHTKIVAAFRQEEVSVLQVYVRAAL